jgi:two-component system phosphate regulon sensor histidine kinase PhoR
MESYLKQRMVNELSRQADVVLLALKNDSAASATRVDEQAKHIAGLEQLRITLIDDGGAVLSDSDIPFADIGGVQNHADRPEIRQAQHGGIGYDIRRSATVGHNFLYMAKRISAVPHSSLLAHVQYLRLCVPFEQVQDQIAHLHFIVVGAGAMILLLIVFVSGGVSKWITKPMNRIIHGVEQIRSGDLNTPLAHPSNDEIGLVAGAINELVEKLKADIVQLKKLEQVRSQFLGNVSHELRTPLFAVQGYLETLLNGAMEDPEVNRSFLRKAQENLDRLNTLLEDLINISQIESGEMKMSFRYFRVNEFLDAAVKDSESMAAQYEVLLRLETGTAPADEAYGDRDRLRQVMSNLISNAIRYNKRGGEVVIRSEKLSAGIKITVKDTGVGIPEEHLTRIFERFYRVDSDRSRSLGGTGLGLAIVKHIVDAHGSRMLVESHTGEGSTFQFELKRS